ncbi:MAG: M20/M25/M40 family metallo-hydrolase [Verrucomicrobiales bacterium]|nr:M20/M25/M40 family metallo-hydrolase [Verrucomicrobiales bacterium]
MITATSATGLLQEFIRIPSVNPDGAPGQNATGEAAMAKAVGDFLIGCGAEVIFEEVLPGRPNVIGHFPGRSTGPGLLFAPHTDTVSVQGMTIDPFAAEIRDDKIFGRGASDTKGTMAAMLWALYELKDQLPTLKLPVSFVGLMGEEAGQPGSKHFARAHAQDYSFAIVGEPTELETVHAHKGCVWIELSTAGRSCHGSTPELGENAIRKMMPLLMNLLEQLENALSDYADPTLGASTVSLGKMEGGTSPNIVPSLCRAILDFRETPALHAAGGSVELVKSILKTLDPSGSIRLNVIGDSVPLLTDPGIEGVKRLQSIGSKITTAPWFCDAGRLGECGLAAVACGPGSIAQAHTKDEFLSINDLNAGVAFYRQFLETYSATTS